MSLLFCVYVHSHSNLWLAVLGGLFCKSIELGCIFPLCFITTDGFIQRATVLLLYTPEASGGYFGLAFAMPPPPPRVREIFGVNAVRGKLHQLGSPNLQDIFIGGKLLWD